MAEKISKEEVEHVARLARLSLTPEEIEKYTQQIGDVLDYVDQLPGGERFKIYDSRFKNGNASLREDEIKSSEASTEELLANVPRTEGTSIKVPAVFGGEK